MPEAGGPANQSGLLYQNGIAARYLGRLCDPRVRPSAERVIEVRVEAPGPVDDVVVTFADGHRDWVQAKEHLEPSGEAFAKVWLDFEERLTSAEFGFHDRLTLVTDDEHSIFRTLEELSRRAKGARGAAEWDQSCGLKHRSALDRVMPYLRRSSLVAVFNLFQHLEIEMLPMEALERDLPSLWVPESTVPAITLYCLLRDTIAGHARVRKVFRQEQVVESLREKHRVTILRGRSDEDTYRSALARLYACVGVPGTSISGDAAKIYVPPLMRIVSRATAPQPQSLVDELDEPYGREGERIALEDFSIERGEGVLLTASAGLGKSELLRALVRRESGRGQLLPALVPLADLIDSNSSVAEYLAATNRRYAVSIDWPSACEDGRVLVLLDGLDELTGEERTRAIGAIRLFASRFPRASWLIASRESTPLLRADEVRELALEPADENMRVKLCSAWLDSRAEAEVLSARIGTSRDLSRLASVPLFLGMLVEHARQSRGDLPARRSEVLADYVERILAPHERIGNRSLRTPVRTLESVAERFAVLLLQEGKAEVRERDLADLLSEAEGDERVQTILGDLFSSGLLQRRGRLVRFAFALLGEFLAGRFLARESAERLIMRIRMAASRPWFQATQFAIELVPDADLMVRTLMTDADDAFGGRTLTLGRAVANGARVSPATRSALGERLGTLWLGASFGFGAALTSVLSDGFATDLPATVRDVLMRGERLHQGGDELLVAAKDDTLTRSAVEADFDQFGHSLGRLAPAVSRVAEVFVELVIRRARAPRWENNHSAEFGRLGCLLRDLTNMPVGLRDRVVADHALPVAVRLGALLHKPGDLAADAAPLVQEALWSLFADEYTSRTYVYLLHEEALWRLPDAESRWHALVRDGGVSEGWRKVLLFSVTARRSVEDAKRLLGALTAGPLPKAIETHRLLTLAYLGDREAMRSVITRLLDMTQREIVSWMVVATRYSGDMLVDEGIDVLEHAPLTQDERVDTGLFLALVMGHEVSYYDLSGGMGVKYRRLHTAAPRARVLLRAWAESSAQFDRIELLGHAAELGDRDACTLVRQELEAFLRTGKKISTEVRDVRASRGDRAIVTALSMLSRIAPLPPTMLCDLASRSSYNGRATAFKSLAVQGTEQALDALLGCQESLAKPHERDLLSAAASQLAGTLGTRLVRDSRGDLVRDVRQAMGQTENLQGGQGGKITSTAAMGSTYNITLNQSTIGAFGAGDRMVVQGGVGSKETIEGLSEAIHHDPSKLK